MDAIESREVLHASTRPPIDFRDLPGPRAVPIFGNLHQVDKAALHSSLETLAGQYGTLYRFRMGSADCLVVSDSEVVSHVLRARPEAVSRSPWMASLVKEIGLTGVFAAEGAEWKVQRMLVTRAFTPELVRHFVPEMLEIVDRLLRRWRHALTQGETPDVARDLKAMSLDVTVAMAMGEHINSLESDVPLQTDIQYLFESLGRRGTTPVPYWRYFKLAQDRSADAAATRVREHVRKMIDRTRLEWTKSTGTRKRPRNLLEAMVAAADEPNASFTDEMLVGNALTMVFAGEDTTASTLAWTLLLLSAHPDAARRLAAEADLVMAGGSSLTSEQIDQLDYAEAVVHESMRLKPVAPMLPLCANHEQRVGPVLVPAGTRLLLLTRLAWQTSGQFEAPDAFNPDRWLKDGGLASASDPNRKMVPFGGGPRLCPGRYLAMVEMKAVLCLLAAHFDFVQSGQPMPSERLAFTMKADRADCGLQLRGLRRTVDQST